MSLFIALGVSLGFALIHVPNVELVTATIFIAGYLMGIKEGLIIGALTETLYSLLNPLGLASPPLLIAQVISMSLAGGLGGILGKQKSHTRVLYHIQLALAGLFSTLVFAVLTTLSFVLLLGLSANKLIGSFIYGLGFYVIHLLSNTLIFLILVPLLLNGIIKAGFFSLSLLKERQS